MAMKQLTTACPHCKKVYRQRTIGAWGRKLTEEDRWQYGSPLCSCPSCKRLFIDKDIKELAITPLRSFDKDKVTASTRMLLVLALLLGLFMYFIGQRLFAAIVTGIGLIYLIADLALYPSRMKKLESERKASERRLSDRSYAAALKKAGYDIPERYLK